MTSGGMAKIGIAQAWWTEMVVSVMAAMSRVSGGRDGDGDD
jgi:hypothetical protein